MKSNEQTELRTRDREQANSSGGDWRVGAFKKRRNASSFLKKEKKREEIYTYIHTYII